MEKIKIYNINWDNVNKVKHNTFGEGKVERFFLRSFDDVQIPFVIIKYKKFKSLYIVGDWENFYKSYDSIKVNVSIGLKVKHFKFGEGIIRKIEHNIRKYVLIEFLDGIRRFNVADLTYEFFDTNILSLFDNTFKEMFIMNKNGTMYLYDGRNENKNNLSSYGQTFFLHRVVFGSGYRNYDCLVYEQEDDFINISIDKTKNKQTNFYYDPYPIKKIVINAPIKDYDKLVENIEDDIWIDSNKLSDNRISLNDDYSNYYNREIQEHMEDYSRENDTGWSYSDDE